ncbi:hypothetical protein Taro_045467 [Colocasia esculenta]|uniref:Uncharacterized protein n=1 Tax=Colocasia esculenta TaxID=4460 RepID=A0A843X0B2_COLES|nr:hypothetical protein [Colocasia esculenta]
MIHLPQRPGQALRLLGNEALVHYNPDRCYLQCGAARTVVPLLSHYPTFQTRKMDDDQDERDVQSAIIHWEGCSMSLLQVRACLHLPALRRGILERPGLVPIARRWDSCRDTHTLSDQLAAIQDAIDSYPQLDRSLGLRQSAVEFPSRDRMPRPHRSFWGLHDTTDWCERENEQIQNWERRGKQVKSFATTNDAYLQAFALKYGAKVYKGARRQVDMTGETASLRALLYSAMQDREIAQREVEQLRKELERVRRAAGAGAFSSRAAEGSQSDLEDRLVAAVRRAEETQTELAERVREGAEDRH